MHDYVKNGPDAVKAYLGLSVVECPNQNCDHFSQKLRDDVEAKARNTR